MIFLGEGIIHTLIVEVTWGFSMKTLSYVVILLLSFAAPVRAAAVYSGCAAPPSTFRNVWYFDPVHGKTPAAGGNVRFQVAHVTDKPVVVPGEHRVEFPGPQVSEEGVEPGPSPVAAACFRRGHVIVGVHAHHFQAKPGG